MLDISDLHVNVDDTEVLHDINLHIGQGETHVLMGPNGSGKSTLLKAVMGFGGYTITAGSIVFRGTDITHMPIHERAHLGIGMMFQHPPAISGLKLGKLLTATSHMGEGAIEALAQSVTLASDDLLEGLAAVRHTTPERIGELTTRNFFNLFRTATERHDV